MVSSIDATVFLPDARPCPRPYSSYASLHGESTLTWRSVHLENVRGREGDRGVEIILQDLLILLDSASDGWLHGDLQTKSD